MFNLLLLIAIVGLAVLGYVRAMESFINIGLAFFALDVVTRYFELSWDLLDRSLVFVVGGGYSAGPGDSSWRGGAERCSNE